MKEEKVDCHSSLNFKHHIKYKNAFYQNKTRILFTFLTCPRLIHDRIQRTITSSLDKY